MQQKLIEGFRLSPQQKYLWPLSHSYTCSAQAVFSLQGILNRTALYDAIQSVIERHEILRTTFQQLLGMTFPVQVVSHNNSFFYQEIDLSHLALDEQQVAFETFSQEEMLYPFDFEHGPLFRSGLIKLSTSEHILYIKLPSLCADICTFRNIIQEIASFYANSWQSQNQSDDLLQYSQASEWLNELLEEEEAVRAKDYWLKQVPPTLFTLTLPQQERPCPHTPIQFASTPVSLTPDLVSLLHTDTLSPSLFLQTCWHALLGRFTDYSEIAVGTAFDGRKFDELRGASGPYTTYLPVRVPVVADLAFSTLLEDITQATQQANIWQEYFSWEHMRPSLGLDPNQAYFPICFEFDSWPVSTGAADLRFCLLEQDRSSEQYFLKLSCLQVGTQVTARLSYRPDLFTSEAIARLAENLETLSQDALHRPTTLVQDLEIVGPTERTHLLIDLNDTVDEFPSEDSIHYQFAQQVHATPDQIALNCQEHQLTYQELNRRANQLCHWLQRNEVRAGVFVGLFLERSVEMLIALSGVLKAGAAYIPLDPMTPRSRLAQQLGTGHLAVLLTQEHLLEQVEAFPGPVLCLDRDQHLLRQETTDDPRDEQHPEQIAYVISTSGSTGKPKGVAVTHRNLSNYTHFLRQTLGGESRLSFASVSTLAADLGNTMIFPALLTGGCLHLLSYEIATDGADFTRYMVEHAIDVLKIVPSHLRAVLIAQESWESKRNLLPARYLICGGEAFSLDLLKQLQEINGTCQIINHYGPTETTVGALLYRVEAQADEMQRPGTVPIGRPIANTDIYLLDRQLRPVPYGVPGELYIGGAGVALGYLDETGQTAQQFIPHPFTQQIGSRLYKTGDSARYLQDGTIEFLGRSDRQVKIRGFRVELGEIETVLRQNTAINDAVVSFQHSETSERSRLVAYVVPRYTLSSDAPRLYQLPNNMSIFSLNKNEADHLYREIFKNRVHLQHGIKLREGDCVLDVGANIGFFTLFAYQQCRKLQVYAFEPNPVAFEKLRLNVERYGLDAHLFNFGLSNEPKQATLSFYPRASVMSGFYADTAEEKGLFRSVIYNELQTEEKKQISNYRQDEMVDELLEGRFELEHFLCELKTLSDVISEQHLTSIDLLKLDVEKSELDVLNGIKEEDWVKIKQIVAEVHDVEERVAGITTLLEKHGFTVAVEQTVVLHGTNIYKVYAARPDESAERNAQGTSTLDHPLTPVNDVLYSDVEVRRYLRERLPEYMVPTVVIPLTAFPLTPNGKINHAMLPAPEQASSSLGKSPVLPRNPLEAVLADIWKQVLGIEQTGIYDNFFEVGGDSILSLQIVALARQKGLGLTTKQIFERQNIAGLATIADVSSPLWKEQESITGSMPLTPIQHWFFEQRIPNRHHWNVALLLETQKDLQSTFVDNALQFLQAHHDALRTRFRADETGYQQFNVSAEVEVPFVQIDLANLSPEKQTDVIELLLTALNTSLHLTHGPLFRAVSINIGLDKANQLLMVFHHLIMDGISLRILLEDFQVLYQQLERGEVMQLPPKTTSFRYWARQLTEYAQSTTLHQELPYWTATLPSVVSPIPRDNLPTGEDGNTEESICSISVTLQPEETRELLQEVPKTYHTQMNDVLLTALAQAITAWTGEHSILVDLEGHGREEILKGVDLSRTIGWFTTQFPVLLHSVKSHTPGDAIKMTKEQLRAVPDHGIGYGLLRYLQTAGNVAEQLRDLPQAEVRFNYLGQFDQTISRSTLFTLADKPHGPLYCLQGERQYLLDITGSIIGGQLQVTFDYSANIYHRDTLEKLAENFIAALHELIVWCQQTEEAGYTPSDFPEAGLSQEELENFLKNWTKE